MENYTVRDFMNDLPAKVHTNMSIVSALRILLEKKQPAAAVVDEHNHLTGLLSEADCIKGTISSGFYEQEGALVGDKMSTELQTIKSDSSLISAIDIFSKYNRRVLPVIEGKKLVGMLTREHILRALLKEVDHPTQHAHIA